MFKINNESSVQQMSFNFSNADDINTTTPGYVNTTVTSAGTAVSDRVVVQYPSGHSGTGFLQTTIGKPQTRDEKIRSLIKAKDSLLKQMVEQQEFYKKQIQCIEKDISKLKTGLEKLADCVLSRKRPKDERKEK